MNIIATVRRLSEGQEFEIEINKLILDGIKYFRFNLGKCLTDEQLLYNTLQDAKLVKSMSNDIKIILDIPFPGKKYRLANCKIQTQIVKGKEYTLWKKRTEGNNTGFTLSEDIDNINFNVDDQLMYDSGQGSLTVIHNYENRLILRAENDFLMYRGKSLSLGERRIMKCSYSSMLEKILLYFNPDAIALSFVETKEDLKEALTWKEKRKFELISKIETYNGVQNADEIISESDAIMFGRGDFLLDKKMGTMFYCEKKLSDLCIRNKKNYYLATGFLNSLIDNYMPSQSDLIDVSYAVDLAPTALVVNVALAYSGKMHNVLDLIDKIHYT